MHTIKVLCVHSLYTLAGWGAEETLPLLPMGTDGVTVRQMPVEDDLLTLQIFVPGGFPIGRSTFFAAYVSYIHC